MLNFSEQSQIKNIFNYENNFLKNESVDSELIIPSELVDIPDVSVMIPTFKRPELLKYAIQSAITQKTNYKYEIVVIDNDDSNCHDVKNLILEFNDKRISYYRNKKNIGMFGNWNRCIELANAKWLVILNDDDLLDQYYIEYMYKTTKYLEDCDALACSLDRFKENENNSNLSIFRELLSNIKRLLTLKKVSKVSLNYLFFEFISPANGCLIKKKNALSIGGFNEMYFPISDAIFMSRLADKCNLYCVENKLYKYRISVNESLKPETMMGFIYGNIYHRHEIMLRLKWEKNRIMTSMCNYFLDMDILNYASKIPLSDDDAKEIKIKFSKNGHVSHFYAFLMKILTRFIVLLFFIKGKKNVPIKCYDGH